MNSEFIKEIILYTFHCNTNTTRIIEEITSRPLLNIPRPSAHGQQPIPDLELVVASTESDDRTWLYEHLSYWRKSIYVIDDDKDDSNAIPLQLSVPENKGQEAMAYLTYIIDRYDSLPSNVIFTRGSRFAWHNDNPDYDGLPILENFRLSYLREAGYVNMRCAWVVGCPAEIRPELDEGAARNLKGNNNSVAGVKKRTQLMTKHVYKRAFEELLPELPVPEVVAVGCCAQFGVTAETIRQRPREDYIRFHEWLLSTSLDDSLSGGVFEYSWHIIFGRSPVHCPSAQDCYCKVYGVCDTVCDAEGSCQGRYTLPRYSIPPSLLVGRTKVDTKGVGPI
ncbi:hypothetical protein F5Y16DRAFT_415106 [Xylariaceae sp. FL0255]|nr:hypothetical protein F5Y16DRAFT_415106 [Xylariaceae sp. FL0255]